MTTIDVKSCPNGTVVQPSLATPETTPDSTTNVETGVSLTAIVKVWGSEERPRFSRVGAVVCVEEEIRESSDPPFVPRVLVLHNPYARNPLPENPWSSFTQLVRRGDGMVWTDKE